MDRMGNETSWELYTVSARWCRVERCAQPVTTPLFAAGTLERCLAAPEMQQPVGVYSHQTEHGAVPRVPGFRVFTSVCTALPA